MKSSLWAASRSLVFCDKISCPWVQGFLSNEGVKEGIPLKIRYFAIIGSYCVKTVADKYRHAAYHNKHNIDDPERPWTLEKGFFVNFFAIFGCSEHFDTELRRNG